MEVPASLPCLQRCALPPPAPLQPPPSIIQQLVGQLDAAPQARTTANVRKAVCNAAAGSLVQQLVGQLDARGVARV